MMKKFMILGFLALGLLACDEDTNEIEEIIDKAAYAYDFENDMEGWEGAYAGHVSEAAGLEVEQSSLPEPLDTGDGTLKIVSENDNGYETFLFIKKQITDLEPNTMYDVTFEVEFASVIEDRFAGQDTLNNDTTFADTLDFDNVVDDSLFIKAGVVQEEPLVQEEDIDFLTLNAAKGEFGQNGDDLVLLGGDLPVDTLSSDYNIRMFTNENPISITTDSNGSVWLIVGTETIFNKTTVYFPTINVDFE